MVFDEHFFCDDRSELGLQNNSLAQIIIVKMLCTVLKGSLTNRFKINFFHKTIPPFGFQYITQVEEEQRRSRKRGENKKNLLIGLIRKYMVIAKIKSYTQLAAAMGCVSAPTLYRRMEDIEKLTLGELGRIVRFLRIPMEELQEVFTK